MYLVPMTLMMILNWMLLTSVRGSHRSRVTTLHLLTDNVTSLGASRMTYAV